MQEKHIPLRMCIVTREMLPKSNLIRVVKTLDGFKIDKTQKAPGRGFWIKKDKDTIILSKKKKVFNRVFHGEVSNEFYEILERAVNEG